jgi:hypothetical protein
MNNYITINSTNFYPTSVTENIERIETKQRAKNGKLRTNYRAQKHKFTITWNNIHEDDISDIVTVAKLTTSTTFTNVDSESYTVHVVDPSFEYSAENMNISGDFYYNISLTLEEE